MTGSPKIHQSYENYLSLGWKNSDLHFIYKNQYQMQLRW
jgi:hypothetical protein